MTLTNLQSLDEAAPPMRSGHRDPVGFHFSQTAGLLNVLTIEVTDDLVDNEVVVSKHFHKAFEKQC